MLPSDTLDIKEQLIPVFCRKCGRRLKFVKNKSTTEATEHIWLVCPRATGIWYIFLSAHDRHYRGKRPLAQYDAFTGDKK